MSQTMEIMSTAIAQGLIYSLPVMAVYLSSRVITFDDLTVEGSFGIGGAAFIAAILFDWSAWITIPVVIGAGALSGAMTGFLHNHLKMNNLICGIVVTTGLFSICLNLAGANASLPANEVGVSIASLIAISVLTLAAIVFLMKSEVGSLMRVLGKNPQLLERLGKNAATYRIGVLALANALTALAGALFVKWTGYFSIFGNVGTMVIALASLMIGEALSRKLGWSLIVGAILYQMLFSLVIEFELPPSWNSLIKAGLIVGLMALRRSSHAQA